MTVAVCGLLRLREGNETSDATGYRVTSGAASSDWAKLVKHQYKQFAYLCSAFFRPLCDYQWKG